MVFTIALFLILAAYCIYHHFAKQMSHFEEAGIPHKPGWPILGNMAPVVFRRKHISETLREVYNLNPSAKYVGFFDFFRPLYLIRDPELIKSITIKHFDYFPNRKSIIDETLDPLFGGALSNITGEKWKEARNLLSPAFTSSKMKAMCELMIEYAENFVKHLERQPENTMETVSTKDLFTKFTNDVIATCAFGISIDSLKDSKNEFYVLGKQAANVDSVFMLKVLIARAFPKLMKLFRIKFVNDRIGEFFKNIVASTISTRDEKGISRPDMLQLMMDARNKKNKHLKLDITNMTAQVFIFFFGGFDTTSTQMCIMAHQLALNPEIQKKLQDEIDEVMRETNGKPNYEAINEMPYLDAVFHETMRRHTLVPFIDRQCTKAFELPPTLPGQKPVTLKPGDNIWIPTLAIHMDRKYYENPEKFDPDRYLNKKVTVNDVGNLGFGIGPRSCIGNRFAVLETKVLFFYLLSKFNLKPNVKTCTPLKYSKGTFTIKAAGGFHLEIEQRS